MISTAKYLDYGCLQSSELSCVCCGAGLLGSDGFCSDCQTPVDLSRHVAAREDPAGFVSVLGASGAGKTVYLGLLLDILSKGLTNLRGLANSALSVALQEQVVTALERRTFPEKTPSEADSWKWVYCRVTGTKKKEKHLDLIAPDFAGEAISMEVEQPGMYPAIRDVVAKSQGLLILCDSLKVRDAGPGEDLFAMKLASYIAQSHGCGNDSGRRRKSRGPAVAIVFTKCDWCQEAFDDPATFAANNMPRLAEFCQQTFGCHSYFAASVVGSSGLLAEPAGRHMQIPFHVEPRGISEPLEWIMNHS